MVLIALLCFSIFLEKLCVFFLRFGMDIGGGDEGVWGMWKNLAVEYLIFLPSPLLGEFANSENCEAQNKTKKGSQKIQIGGK